MIYTEIDKAMAKIVKPLQEEFAATEVAITKTKEAIKVEDSKRKEAQLRESLQTLVKRQRILWGEIEQARIETFKKLLAKEYDVVGNPKFEKAFSIAWQQAHSSGYSEIENYFSDIVDLIKD